MKISYLFAILILSSLLFSCQKDDDTDKDPGKEHFTGLTVAGYQVATEEILRSIPEEYLTAVRNNLHVAYQHTSHGTHVSYGLFGLPDYRDGDDVLFGITNNDPQTGKLDFRDYALSDYAEEGTDASDLSRDETAFIQATRNYLDDPVNSEINVVMWSWCSISGHNVAENYLPGMEQLISEYGEGGSKIGIGAGKRLNAVTFIFMTGHAESNSNFGVKQPKSQADTIIGYCNAHGYLCLDYFGIDTHDMDGNYWNDAGENGNSESYGGNFYEDWQYQNTEGNGYFYNKSDPGGPVTYGEHTTQHITSNRKAFAMWYLLARIAGWDGNSR
ncbi:MAG TPA: hypothetical protein VHO68_05630 [Bacteroidales bacterium]|nr:hypothetical protein [Bacteroidales bacterium]